MGEVQTLKGLVHRLGYSRGFAEFAFNSIPAAVIDEKKINLSTAMCSPKKCLGRINDPQDLLDGKAFPRCPHPGIAVQSPKIGKVKPGNVLQHGIVGSDAQVGQSRIKFIIEIPECKSEFSMRHLKGGQLVSDFEIRVSNFASGGSREAMKGFRSGAGRL